VSSIIRRTAILSLSRLLNGLITFITPIFLVRILDVLEYGQYREFLLYGMLLAGIAGFSANRSLTYFLPKYPNREGVFLTQSIIIIAISTSLVLLVFGIVNYLFAEATVFDYFVPLLLFCALYANFDFVEMYYVAKGRSDVVLYYGVSRLVLRVTVVIVTAYLTNNVEKVIWAVVAAEAVRFGVVFIAVSAKRKLNFSMISLDTFKEQFRFIYPLGISTILMQLSERASNLFVSVAMGPSALALYVIGGYQRPLVGVLRGALADAIFPDMVRSGDSGTKNPLPLWQRSTVAYCVVLFPIAAVLITYASQIVETLFTSKFLDAVPLFQLFSIYLVLFCFEFDLPMRAVGITKYFLRSSWMGLLLKIAFIAVGYSIIGFTGPAVGVLLAQALIIVYLARKCAMVTDTRIGLLLDWRQIGKIAFSCMIAVPILPISSILISNEIVAALIGAPLFLIVYLRIGVLMGIQELDLVLDRVSKLFRKNMHGKS
jgi:O-antigen/teichoic acid export membrane protein